MTNRMLISKVDFLKIVNEKLKELPNYDGQSYFSKFTLEGEGECWLENTISDQDYPLAFNYHDQLKALLRDHYEVI